MTASTGPRVTVLAIHRYFWPDTPPYAVMLRAMCAHWAAHGHDVEVLSSQPSYKPETSLQTVAEREVVDGIRVRRIAMRPDAPGGARRLASMIRFSLAAAWRVLTGPHRDVVMCSTAPQVLLGWAVSLAARCRRSQFIYHCMDVHPEIGALSGEFANPLVLKILLKLDTATCRRSAAIVVLSTDMRDALVSRDNQLAERVVVINNFDLPDYDPDVVEPPVEARKHEVTTVAFTGNLGRFQGLETVVSALVNSADPALDRVRLVLMGEGAAKAGIEAVIDAASAERGHRVLMLPHGSVAQARAVMRAADYGLVSLSPGVIAYAYPSKVATYLSEGLPVLAGVEEGSALARDVAEWGVGRRLPLESVVACRSTLVELVTNAQNAEVLAKEAKNVWRREFSMDVKFRQWDELLSQLGEAA